jgi:hypothetical protein
VRRKIVILKQSLIRFVTYVTLVLVIRKFTAIRMHMFTDFAELGTFKHTGEECTLRALVRMLMIGLEVCYGAIAARAWGTRLNLCMGTSCPELFVHFLSPFRQRPRLGHGRFILNPSIPPPETGSVATKKNRKSAVAKLKWKKNTCRGIYILNAWHHSTALLKPMTRNCDAVLQNGSN